MDRVREKALVSIGRASGFAALAILCVVMGLSFDPLLMAQTGGALTLGLAAGLMLKAGLAERGDYRRTEAWLLLAPEDRPPADVAARLLPGVIRETCLRFARFAAAVSVGFWALASLLLVLG